MTCAVYASCVRIGERIGKLQEERGWKRRELEARSGVSRDQLSKIINGHHKPSYESLAGLAAAFEMTMAALLEGVSINGADLPLTHPRRALQKGAIAGAG